MSKIVRFAALLLALTMLPALYGFAQTEELSDYEEAIEKLCALGFAHKDDNGLFYPENEITRAEFTAMAVMVTGYEKAVKTDVTESVFEDVRSDMWYTPYIVYAVQKGIASGYSSTGGRFYPDETITLNEAVKILTSAMGYKEYAENNGGYPDGYINMAKSQGLYNNVPSREDQKLRRAEAAQMCQNALEAEVLVNTANLSGDKYTKVKLMEYLGLVNAKAVVVQSGRKSLSETSAYDEDEVVFSDGTVCDRNGFDTGPLVGYKTEYIYEEDNGSDNPKLLYIQKLASNKEIILNARDIAEASGRTIITEDETGRKKSYNISKDVSILYNGSAVTSFSIDMLKPRAGYVKLVSNGSGDYNVAFVESYINVYVSGKNTSKLEIFDKYDISKNETLSEEDGAAVEIVDTDGAVKTFADIEAGDVVSVFKSQDGMSVRAVISKRSISGVVTTVDEEKLALDGEEYEMTAELVSALESGSFDIPPISVGAKVTVYIDSMGYIAAYKAEFSTERMFAYMKSFVYYNDEEEGVKLRLFTQEGEHRSYICADKVRIDGTNYKEPFVVYSILENLPRHDGLIVCQLDEEGRIKYIDTLEKGSGEKGQYLIKTSSGYSMNDGKYTGTGTQRTYKDKSMSFDMKVLVSGNTPIFQIPSENVASAPEDYFAIKTTGDFTNDGRYYLDTYQLDTDSYYTDAIVMYSASASNLTVDNDTNPAVVKKVYTTLVDDEAMICVEAIQGGQEIKLYPNNDEVFKNIKGRSKKDSEGNLYVYKSFRRGDVFRYKKMPNGRVGAVEMLVGTIGQRTGDGSDEKEAAYNEESNTFALMRFACRNVYGKSGGLIRLTAQNPAEIKKEDAYLLETHKAANYNIVVVDTENGEVRKGSINDIKGWKTEGGQYSTVLVQTRYGDARTIVVFDKEIH